MCELQDSKKEDWSSSIIFLFDNPLQDVIVPGAVPNMKGLLPMFSSKSTIKDHRQRESPHSVERRGPPVRLYDSD